jgi:hypothetical protein
VFSLIASASSPARPSASAAALVFGKSDSRGVTSVFDDDGDLDEPEVFLQQWESYLMLRANYPFQYLTRQQL